MSHKPQLAKEVTVLPRDNNADNILFASWPLFIIVCQLRLKLKVCPGNSFKKQLEPQIFNYTKIRKKI